MRDCTYAEWLGVGMALKDAGYECSVWDEWSKDDQRYVEGDCERRWATFKGSEHPVNLRTCLLYTSQRPAQCSCRY